MKTLGSVIAMAALAAGCAVQESNNVDPDTGTTASNGLDRAKPPPEKCPAIGTPGEIVDVVPIEGGGIVAVDREANRFYSLDRGGLIKLTATDDRVYSFEFGSVFALDRAGKAFVAGSFTAPITIGCRQFVPSGDIDTLVVELSPSGDVWNAFQLGLSSGRVQRVAVDRGGRIAVSGTTATAVLDPSGRIHHLLPYSGKVAFDSHDNLYVGGSFTGSIDFGGGHALHAASSTDIDAFLVKLDMRGQFLAGVRLGDAPLPITGQNDVVISSPQPQIITDLAINAHDHVAILGTFTSEMDLFGQILVFTATLPSGSTLGPFVAEFDSSLGVMFSTPLDRFYSRNPVGGIAIDSDGNVIVSHNTPSEAFAPFGFPVLTKLDLDDHGGWQIGPEFSFARGVGLGVAVDPCDNIVWADSERANPLGPAELLLHTVAR
jgi:hypothetical protein